MKLRGKVHKYGTNVDTDAIIPARYLNVSEHSELAKYCMAGIDEGFVKKLQKGDIIVAGSNFGCGSSREHAPLSIKAAGVSCVIADSFARIFYRNAMNIGLPILECDEAVAGTNPGDILEVELAEGKIRNLTNNKVFQAKAYPDFMLQLISVGGLIEYTKSKLESGRVSK